MVNTFQIGVTQKPPEMGAFVPQPVKSAGKSPLNSITGSIMYRRKNPLSKRIVGALEGKLFQNITEVTKVCADLRKYKRKPLEICSKTRKKTNDHRRVIGRAESNFLYPRTCCFTVTNNGREQKGSYDEQFSTLSSIQDSRN